MSTDACFECGSQDGIHFHHIVPRSRGGTKTVPLCHVCHGHAHGVALGHSTLIKEGMAKAKAAGKNISRPRKYDWELIVRMHDSGLTYYRIGKILKISDKSVAYVVKQSKKNNS